MVFFGSQYGRVLVLCISPLILVSDAGRQLLYLSSKGSNLVVARVFSQNRCRAVAVAVAVVRFSLFYAVDF
jgi:hypothetical protein